MRCRGTKTGPVGIEATFPSGPPRCWIRHPCVDVAISLRTGILRPHPIGSAVVRNPGRRRNPSTGENHGGTRRSDEVPRGSNLVGHVKERTVR